MLLSIVGLLYKMLRRAGLVIHKVPNPSPDFQVSNDVKNEVYAYVAKSADDQKEAAGWRSYLSSERLAFFHEILAKCKELGLDWTQGSIADAGCGSGYLMRIIAQANPSADLVGYDTFDKSLELSKLMCPSGRYLPLAIHEIEDQHLIFFCTEVLEHLVDPKRAMQHLYAKTLTGGGVFLTVPNGRYDHLDAGEQREDGTAYWGHINFWSPESWELFLKDAVPDATEIVSGVIGGDKLFGWVKRA